MEYTLKSNIWLQFTPAGCIPLGIFPFMNMLFQCWSEMHFVLNSSLRSVSIILYTLKQQEIHTLFRLFMDMLCLHVALLWVSSVEQLSPDLRENISVNFKVQGSLLYHSTTPGGTTKCKL